VRASGRKAWQMAMLLKEDWFHFILRRHTALSIYSLLMVWTASIIGFAALYQRVDRFYEFTDCGLSSSFGKLSFGAFFAFSLQTCTTVGYTLPGTTQLCLACCSTPFSLRSFTPDWLGPADGASKSL
jgi:hypothetical protein